MTSDFLLKTLANLIYSDKIEKAKQRRFARNVEDARHVTSNEYHGFVLREGQPCQG
ncbi:hypothetical protein ACFLSZ_01305 [Candidatus Bipolaricaulota bacterium]